MKSFVSLSMMVLIGLAAGPAGAEEEPDLADNMRSLQYFLHKLSLSVAANHRELAGFYAHEIEEALEDTLAIERYHDQPIGELASAMLVPAFESFEQTLDEAGIDAVRSSLNRVIEACNACHRATGYGFIRIAPDDDNPYLQSFAPEE